MRFIVYKHTNKINGKSYLGFTSYTIDERWNQHVRASRGKRKSLFLNALISYGTSDDVWLHETLGTYDTEQEAKLAEISWIARLKTNGLREGHVGYNMTDGGDGTRMLGPANPMFGKKGPLCPSYGRKHTDDARKRISEFHSIFKNTDEWKAFMTQLHTGRVVSEETRKQISETKQGTMTGELNHAYGKTYRTKETHPEWAEKISIALEGDKNPFFGKQHSDETKAIISKKKKGRKNPKTPEWEAKRAASYSRNCAIKRFRKASRRWFCGKI